MAKQGGPVHRVVMIPRKPDGSPAIDGDFEVIGDKDFAIAAAAEQLGQNAISNADHEDARAQAAGDVEPGSGEDDETRIARHRDLMAAAAKQAASEIEAAHSGEAGPGAPIQRSVPVETATTRSSAKKTS